MPEIKSVSQSNAATVLVNWSSANTAANYTVTVVGIAGDEHVCHSNGTSCHVTNLPCGSNFDVSATASSSAGNSMPSYTVPLETGQLSMAIQSQEAKCVTGS